MLNDTQSRILAALATGHESDAPATAAQVADALGMTAGQVAAALGKLRALGLVERGTCPADGRATWARYDSAAPGLDAAQVEALAAAETVRPVRAQVEALETFGPDLGDGCHGLARKADAPRRPESCSGACEAAREAAARGMFYRAAALALEGRPYVVGHGHRARLEAVAADYTAQADAQARKVAAAERLALEAERPQVRAAAVAVLEAAQAPARPALPPVGAILPNGCRVLDIGQGVAFGRAYVMAETLGRAGHPFATWAIEADTWATSWGTYHETARAAAATLADRIECN